MKLTVRDIYETINQAAPFASQASWDNSGLLVGAMEMPAQRILTTLDISCEVLAEAKRRDVQLIVAHHPVIFSPLKLLSPDNPAYQLAAAGIAAICVHTPLDIAPAGLNARAFAMLQGPLQLAETRTVLEPAWTDGRGFGWVADCQKEMSAGAVAEVLQEMFHCAGVRYAQGRRSIRKIAYCSGSAASMLELAAEMGCDAMITGDVKHDRWYAAEYAGMSLFDCGHYETEQFAAQILAEWIEAAYPSAEVICFPGKAPSVICAGGEAQ